MAKKFLAEREVERLQAMHETVERLRSQLKRIRLHSPKPDPDLSDQLSPGVLSAQDASPDKHT
jgi:hypothetical protein